jgi:hypothetical protein
MWLFGLCFLGCGSEGPQGAVAGAGAGGTSNMNAGGGMSGTPCDNAGSNAEAAPAGNDAPSEPALLASSVLSITDGSFAPGRAPASCGPEDLPEIVLLEGPSAVTNGGSATLLVTLDAPVDGPQFVLGLAGTAGHHTLTAADADLDGVHEIKLQVLEEASQTSLGLSIAPTDGAGKVGAYEELEIELVQSGTGDVKITLSFDRTHDLDLHVLEPGGEEVSPENPASANGGRLDLDSGSECNPNTGTSENIFWPSGAAPMGEYRVAVLNFEQCTPGDIAFTVRIAHDDVVNTYPGSFVDGSASTRVEVATFSR